MSVLDLARWAEAAPSLTLSPVLDLSRVTRRGVADPAEAVQMRREGVCVHRGGLPAARADRLRRGVDEVRASLGHEVLALLYDEPWLSVAENALVLEALLGEGLRAVPLPYVNYVPPGSAGFSPHRDRYHDPLDPSGLPNMMTAWFALTDATPERACLSVLPACFDPCFPHALGRLAVPDLRDVRALPVLAGDVVLFNQATLHWGTRNVSAEPRVSFAIELERAGAPHARSPSLDLRAALGFEQRVGFLGAVIEGLHQNNIDFTPEVLELGRKMRRAVHPDLYEPGAAA